MRFLFINPERLTQPPFGILYIAAVLEHNGHEVKVLEIPYMMDEEARNILAEREISGYLPDAIGITFMTPQAEISKGLIGFIKSKFKDIKIIAGGVHPTLMYGDALSWGADVVCVGEGENTMLELANAMCSDADISGIKGIAHVKDGFPILTGQRPFITNLDALPFPAYHLIDSRRFARRTYAIRGLWLRCGLVMTARGCPARCTFCCRAVHGRVVREFGISRVLDEVEWLKKIYDIEGLWIIDDTFSIKEKRVVEFCDGLNARKLDLTWACQARVDTFTDVMARSMRSSGCVQIDFGVESGSQRVLDSLHKGIKLDETKRAFEICKRHGIRPVATVMVGSPGETREDIAMTRALLDQIKPAFLGCFFSTPFPGTELYDVAVKNRWIDPTAPINWQTMESPVMTATLTGDELKREFEDMQKYNKTSALGYMLNPAFICDMLKLSFKNKKESFRLLSHLARGRKRDAINTFLFMFRKEFLN
ncbi:MAG: B12-binding domain-containing radical SAM protein [Candidatus Omnitrophica bacterium]|nr:B12-binding domain-containing radical SAM protein [Candidatus Omnitrophota bacterium]MBU1808061.1 B12-binding domain-containing radical SAM protein [Candidatus Omnitrophota bacterium]